MSEGEEQMRGTDERSTREELTRKWASRADQIHGREERARGVGEWSLREELTRDPDERRGGGQRLRVHNGSG